MADGSGEGSSPRMRGKREHRYRSTRDQRLIPAHAGKTLIFRCPSTSTQAHPRACGENPLVCRKDRERVGSSPRMRGKLVGALVGAYWGRLIPAHAGKTKRRALQSVSRRAHPRACGENALAVITISLTGGSSPRMRGKRFDAGKQRRRAGLIPAHAGKTRCAYAEGGHVWAHPRACGENARFELTGVSDGGSSPRMRGKLRIGRCSCESPGLIPAHAGKTSPQPRAAARMRAHPRACGENAPPAIFDALTSGSSPRMRGKLYMHAVMLRDGRLIPAHAGKTSAAGWIQRLAEAHPRACGENWPVVSDLVRHMGSSPRMRGKLVSPATRREGEGLIPAHAGKTRPTMRTPSIPRAHPRACGENPSQKKPPRRCRGSSPRMRGKRLAGHGLALAVGLIPAHAGKTPVTRTSAGTEAAHPRACGENVFTNARRGVDQGSSPRMRGKRSSGRTTGGISGLIPAHAGKTLDGGLSAAR